MSGTNGNTSISLRDRLLAVPLKRIPVDIPGYPTLWLQEQTAAERLTYEKEFLAATKGKGPDDELDHDFVTALVARHLSDADGNRLFESTAEDCEVLRGSVSWAVIDYLYNKCSDLFKWTEKEMKSVEEEIEKDPFDTPSSNSPTNITQLPRSSSPDLASTASSTD